MIRYVVPAIVLLTIFFAVIYSFMGEEHIQYTDNTNTMVNNLYFSSITQTLLGDPNMRPKSTIAKLVVSTQAFSTFLFLYFPIYLYIK